MTGRKMTGNPVSQSRHSRTGIVAVVLASMALSACDTSNLVLPGKMPTMPQATGPIDPAPDAAGIIRFSDFRVVVARDRDTVGRVANRIGMDPVVLARYNGLPTTYILREGERLALPNDAQIAAVEEGWTPEVVTGALDSLPGAPGKPASTAPGKQLLRHQVERGETLLSIAQLYGISATALASWNGLTGDLRVVAGQSLIIPPEDGVTPTVEPAQPNIPGTNSVPPPPPSVVKPLPENQPVEVEKPKGPDLAQKPAAVKRAAKFAQPVTGKVVKPYSTAPGRAKNEGIDYQTAPGAPVSAGAAGEVALVSRSLGGLGTIVLIRHADDLMSVYGRVDDVVVTKGEAIRKGQKIGRVADGTPPIFHFEIRRGTQSIDPTPFL